MNIVIKNGWVLDPKNKIDKKADVLIKDGKIAKVGGPLSGEDMIDAKGMIVTPGLIDMHVHLREPGREDKETIATCSAAAAAGGITTIVGMPNTTPVADNQTVIEFVNSKAKDEAVGNVYATATISKDKEGREIAEIGDLYKAGAIALTDDGSSVKNTLTMMRAFQYASMFGLPIISHSEDYYIGKEKWAMNEGEVSTKLGIPAKSQVAEEIIIAREILLSEETGQPVHFTHINTRRAAEMIRDAKKRGINITCDTCPQYFSLTEKEVLNYNPNAKMNPPLRPEDDRKAMEEYLKSGVIDCIATDHAPHLLVEKYIEFEDCANGIVGLETSLGLALTYFEPSIIAEVMSRRPAEILKLKSKGHLTPGADADVTIIDPDKSWTVDKNKFKSKGQNTPWDGTKLKGKAFKTIIGGKVAYEDKN